MKKLIGPEHPPISGKKAKQLVILLHGYGANGMDLFNLSSFFNQVLPDAHFISPNAPYSHSMVPMGCQWFDLENRNEDNIYKGINNVSPILEKFIEEKLNQLSLGYKDLVLIGFSQGAMLAMHVAPRLNEKIAAVISFSGAMIKPSLLSKELKSIFPILLIHGDDDEVVSFAELAKAEQAFKESNFKVKTHIQKNAGHTIDNSGIDAANQFLIKTLITS